MTGGTGQRAAGPVRNEVQRLSAAEFAEAAAGRRPVVTEQTLRLIREDALPEDWLATTVDCYSTEAGYYELAQYGHIQPLKATVDAFVADALATTAARAVLDVGVGDGHRLARICSLVTERCGRVPQPYGIELSELMIDRARARGLHVIKHDMRKGVPDLGRELDGILFLSADLGYLMDPVAGSDLRSEVLDSVYEHLSPGGVVVLELASREPRVSPDGADVFHFSRAPVVRDQDGAEEFRGPETWQYVKTFTRAEVVALIERSAFAATTSSLRYVVRDSPDVHRIGQFIEDRAISPEESYRILVSLVK
jgi:SAM-dependent methyltransferase